MFDLFCRIYLAFIFFPRDSKSREKAGSKRAKNGPYQPAGGKKRLNSLVVLLDRYPEFANLLSQELEIRGLHCILAGNAKEICSKTLETTPDVVVLSSTISASRDGIEAAKQILSKRPLTEIIVLTDLYSEIEMKDEKIGIELFLDRGLGIKKIADSISQICDMRKSAFHLVAR